MAVTKCTKCIYRASYGMPWECEYIVHTGKRRPCPADNKCTEFKEGARLKTGFEPMLLSKSDEY